MDSAAVTGAQVVAEALRWLETPYHHQAHLRGVGVDCGGLVRGVMIELGLRDADVTQWPGVTKWAGYRRTPEGDSLLQACREYLTEIPREEIRAGDVCAFVVENDPVHLGIVYDYRPGTLGIIHATNRRGVDKVIRHRLVLGKHMRFAAAFRMPGVV